MSLKSRRAGLEVNSGRIRAARLEAGLSLADLAGDEVSRTLIHLVEHGRSRPSERVLNLIAERTGKPVSYFLQSATERRQQGGELALELSRTAAQVRRFATATRLTPGEREAMKMLEVMLRQGAALTRAVEGRAVTKR